MNLNFDNDKNKENMNLIYFLNNNLIQLKDLIFHNIIRIYKNIIRCKIIIIYLFKIKI